MNKPSAVVVWFKRDLRVSDHAPLVAAVASGYPVIPLFVVETDYWKTQLRRDGTGVFSMIVWFHLISHCAIWVSH